jgi:hypothetical protein
MEKIIWGIDPGSSTCGIVRLNSGLIGNCLECEPEKVYNQILRLSDGSQFIVVIEDIFPYSMRLTPAVIDTCKLIGELTYRFNTCFQVGSVHLVARNSVKKWIFDTCPDVCNLRIAKKILDKHNRNLKQGKKGLIKLDGEMRQPSFHWVDDRIVIAALKSIYNIPTPKPGKPNIFGLKDHSWQALSVAAWQAHIGKNTNEKQ